MDYAVPGETGVVDDDVNFAVAEVCCALDECGVVFVVCNVAGAGDGLAAVLVDSIRNGLGLGWWLLVCALLSLFPLSLRLEVN